MVSFLEMKIYYDMFGETNCLQNGFYLKQEIETFDYKIDFNTQINYITFT